MVILTLKELEPYKGLRVLDTESIYGIPQRALRKLQTFEQQLLDKGSGYGMPYYAALELHVNGKNTSQMAQGFDIRSATYVSIMLNHFKIPRLSRGEVARRHSYPKGPNGTKAVAYSSEDRGAYTSEGKKDAKCPDAPLAIGSMKGKACPRCQGDLFFLEDIYGPYLDCIQCGHNIDVDTGHSNGVAVS